jgi:ATP-dependent DNA helicase RecG
MALGKDAGHRQRHGVTTLAHDQDPHDVQAVFRQGMLRLLGDEQRRVGEPVADRVEFKETTGQRSDAARTVCAMLNGRGGFLLFGVSDKGTLLGQQVAAHTLEQVSQELRRIDPPAFPDIETAPVAAGREVVVLRVPGGGGPYTYDGRAYLRHGPTTLLMPRPQYERLLLERMHAGARWENQPAQGSASKTWISGSYA